MKTFQTFVTEMLEPFGRQLHALKPHIVKAAQKEYDDWNQDEDGNDEELGGGGICDRISNHIQGIVAHHLPHAHVLEGGQDGDDHSYAIAHNGQHVYSIDIPHHIYEHGGGYSWKKRKGVVFHPHHVMIDKLPVHPNDLE